MFNKRLAALGAASLATVLAAPAFADVGRVEGWEHGHMMGSGWGVMGFGTMILFWGLIIVLIAVAVRWLSHHSGSSGVGNSALNALRTLEERLAKGEIDVAEFEERKKALNS